MTTAIALAVSLSLAQAQQPQQPQQPQTPSSQSSQTTVVVPPPPGQQPVVVQPQDRPLAVAPCPPAEVRARRDPVVTVLVSTLAGGAVGALFGTGVGLSNGDNTSRTWERDIGTGTLVGLGVGAAAGAVFAILDYSRDGRVAVAPMIGGKSAGLAVAGRW